jgi:6-phosphogluconolactonase
MADAADRIADALRQGITLRGGACAALSGGATPEPAYRLLAEKPLDWRCVSFALVDERCVPSDHPASNEGLIRQAFAPALSQGARLIPMFRPGAPPSRAADLAEAAYAPLRFDIAVMGMGADGHTASWFAGAEGLDAALDAENPRSVVALRAPQAAGSANRLSLTLTALKRAERVLLIITGDEKRAALQAAPASKAPVAALFNLPVQIEVLWAP